MLPKLSRLAGYLALAFLGLALSNILIVLVTTQGHEFLATLALWELVAAFCSFTLWAVSATAIAIQRNRATDTKPK